MNTPINELFGSMVFNENVMRQKLPKETYQSLKKTIDEGSRLDENVAHVVATAMKDWALDLGATHFSHWFQPMTGVTAEKHEAFIAPAGDGKVMLDFSAKELIIGEPDASSFPSGGLRATFEARGYTAWDPTSYAFIKDGTLYIPTTFVSYSGEVLDQKTPLLRSVEALNTQALRLVRQLGVNPAHVVAHVGVEQEYFLIDKDLYRRRRDLRLTGRTLFGARPPKGQELDDHYFGSIRPRVSAFMRELDEELWKLGVYSKIRHNESAPAQHELVSIFLNCNLASDHNQLCMEIMKKVADRHGLVCLLHEKPFAGINGSGKHSNWSLGTPDGINFLKPGKNPADNPLFLLFLSAVIAAVDEYGDLLRFAVAGAGNDLRLGGNEAPPPILSIFLGTQLTHILDAIVSGVPLEKGIGAMLSLGVASSPELRKGSTDRNRTSPFAFTGNKFEFRMVGASQSVSTANVVINTIAAESIRRLADRLERSGNPTADAMALVRETVQKHQRVLFNGNNYDEEWPAEAQRRGLSMLRSSVDALSTFLAPQHVALFERHGIFSRTEMEARMDICLTGYSKSVRIEALTMLDMTRQEIYPACMAFQKLLAEAYQAKRAAGLLPGKAELALLTQIAGLTDTLLQRAAQLEAVLADQAPSSDALPSAQDACHRVLPAMEALRETADALEPLVGAEYWPFPTYADLLFGI